MLHIVEWQFQLSHAQIQDEDDGNLTAITGGPCQSLSHAVSLVAFSFTHTGAPSGQLMESLSALPVCPVNQEPIFQSHHPPFTLWGQACAHRNIAFLMHLLLLHRLWGGCSSGASRQHLPSTVMWNYFSSTCAWLHIFWWVEFSFLASHISFAHLHALFTSVRHGFKAGLCPVMNFCFFILHKVIAGTLICLDRARQVFLFFLALLASLRESRPHPSSFLLHRLLSFHCQSGFQQLQRDFPAQVWFFPKGLQCSSATAPSFVPPSMEFFLSWHLLQPIQCTFPQLQMSHLEWALMEAWWKFEGNWMCCSWLPTIFIAAPLSNLPEMAVWLSVFEIAHSMHMWISNGGLCGAIGQKLKFILALWKVVEHCGREGAIAAECGTWTMEIQQDGFGFVATVVATILMSRETLLLMHPPSFCCSSVNKSRNSSLTMTAPTLQKVFCAATQSALHTFSSQDHCECIHFQKRKGRCLSKRLFCTCDWLRWSTHDVALLWMLQS